MTILSGRVWFPIWTALWTAILMGATWPLWEPTASSFGPRIPWFGILCSFPASADWFGVGLIVVGVVGMAVPRRNDTGFRAAAAAYVLGLAFLLSRDQHRLQPWAWQFLLLGVLLTAARKDTALACARALAIGIYIHSALSKFDAAFLQSHGQMLLEGLLAPFSADLRYWGMDGRRAAALAFPIGELAVALLLIFPGTRRWGLWGSIAMHLTLIWILGLGLRHEWGVLLWNGYFIGQNLLLFRPGPSVDEPLHGTNVDVRRRIALGDGVAILLTGFVTLLPLSENWGWCDHWPAWAVYSPRPARVEILIDESAVAALPVELAPFLDQAPPLTEARPFNLDAWSFAVRYCPVYPQLRYRLAVSAALLDGTVADDAVTITVGMPPDRWTGARESFTLHGLSQARRHCARGWVNTRSIDDGMNSSVSDAPPERR